MMPHYKNRNDFSVENFQKEEEDSWSQTLITITPEDDAVLREIKAMISISAQATTSLDLNTDSFIYRRPLVPKYLVNLDELEGENITHAEVQTYLQGLSVVDIPVQYKDQISQTLYMSTPCSTMKYYKDIMTSMRDGPVPELKNTRSIQTKFTFYPNTDIKIVTEGLKIDVTKNEIIKDISFVWDEEDYMQTELNTLISDVIYYLQERTFWILNPTSLSYPITIENYVQTLIRYNETTDSIVVDNETQTELTCEPKHSNTELLTRYQANKSLAYDILDECLNKAVETRILVDDILDEVIEKGVEIVRYPPRDQNIQTLASYKVNEKKEDVLRKLQLSIVVDPLESSIVVLQLIDDLLKSICDTVFNDAQQVAKTILQATVTRSINIGSEIEKIRNQSYDNLIEQILNKRRKRIAKLMAKKKTETVFTQTSISGIHQVTKLEKLIESYSCLCLKHSKCYTCNSIKKDKDLKENIQMLRTQDILLAYTPCNIVSSPFKIEVDRVSLSSTEEKSITNSRIQFSNSSSSGSVATINVAIKSKERINIKDSIDGWTQAIDAALTIPWSPKSSLSKLDTTEGSKNKLTLQTMKVLQILKSTFCIRDTCPMSVVEKLKHKSYKEVDKFDMNSSYNTCFFLKTKDDCTSEENIEDKSNIMDNEIDNTLFENDKCFCHISYTLNTWHQLPQNNHSNKLKIIPIQFNS